jgi:hypothetical protein
MTDLQQAIDALLAFLDAYRTNAPEGWMNMEFVGTVECNTLLDLDKRVYLEARKAGLVDELPNANPGVDSVGRTHVPVGGPGRQPVWCLEWEASMRLLGKLGLAAAGAAEPMPEDDSVWVRAATIWTKDRDRFSNGKAFRRYLVVHPEVRHRHKGQRLEVHAGDWQRHVDAEGKSRLEALEVSQQEADATLEILRKKRRQ